MVGVECSSSSCCSSRLVKRCCVVRITVKMPPTRTYTQAADARAAHPLPRMLDELLGAQLDAADGAAPPMEESRRRAAAHGAALVRAKPYDVWV